MNPKETFPQPYFVAHQCLKRTIIYFFVLLVVVGYICYDDDTQGIMKPSNETSAASHENHSKIELTIEIDDDDNITVDETILLMSDEEINRKYCGSDKCKFLFVYKQPDEESLANEQMRNFIKLAKALNRTMILTNVGHSRISSCRRFPFDFYYSIPSLLQEFPHVSFISQRNFKRWTKLRHEKPTTQHLFISKGGINSAINIVNSKDSLETIQKVNCLNQFEMKFDEDTIFKKIRTGKGSWRLDETRSKFSEFLVNHLNEIEEEIILLNHDLRNPFFPGNLPKIDYSQHILHEADRIVDDLQPFIAVYWRLESTIPSSSQLPECAQRLVETLKRIKTSLEIQNIYFITDYPISSGKQSQQLTEDHHKAMEILNSTVKLNTWSTMNSFSDLLGNNVNLYNTGEFGGHGIHRILDRLIAINSDYFLSSPPGCGASYRDEFTLTVVDARTELTNEGNERLLNIITRW